MRENPTPASGPVCIKHVRNTVPKTLQEATAPAVSSPEVPSVGFPIQAFVTMGSPSPKSYPSGIQLEEPSL